MNEIDQDQSLQADGPENQRRRAPVEHPHWQLVRDLFGFQLKLVVDGLRDVLLSPVSIGAALFGLFTDAENPGKYFYRLMDVGHRSDKWINLFNSHDVDPGIPSPDGLVRRAETFVADEYEKRQDARRRPEDQGASD